MNQPSRRASSPVVFTAALLLALSAAGCNRADTTAPAPADPGMTTPAPGAGTSPGTVPPATSPASEPMPATPPASGASQ